MQQIDINARLIKVAAGKRKHKDYDRTVSRASLYTALSTGHGIAAYMKKYSRRETPETFAVRVEVTEQITPSICENLITILEKAYRSFYRRELTYGADAAGDAKTAEFEAMIADYAGGMGIDGYLEARLVELNVTDPNAWIIQEWKDFDNVIDYASPYPYEATSEMALDFQYDRGELQYLTVQTWVENPDGGDPLQKLTCYQKDFSCTLTQTGRISAMSDVLPTGLIDGETVVIDGKVWVYNEFYHGLGEIKAKRAGYKRDKLTNGRTFVWPIEAAEPYLLQTLKVVSELQITAANVAFPKEIRFGDVCNAPGCDGGYADGHICGSCDGTGRKKSSTSVLEEIVITPMPENPDDMIDLSKVIHYISPDVSILQWQEAYVERLEAKCKSAVLNSEIYSRKEIADTATGKNLDQDNANDFVYKYFVFYAEFWRFTVYAFADIVDKADGLYAEIIVNKDLKLKTLNQLLDDLKKANDSGASPATRQGIEWDIMRVMTVDDPDGFLEYQVRERFNPFSGFTDEQKVLWSQSDLIPRAQRVLYANLGYIFDQLEYEVNNFYKLPYAAQKELVDSKVNEILAETTAIAPQILA